LDKDYHVEDVLLTVLIDFFYFGGVWKLGVIGRPRSDTISGSNGA
jgi:hypothetical protein